MKKNYFVVCLLFCFFIFFQLNAQDVENFESGDLSAFEWETSGDNVWSVTSNNPHGGSYSVQSGAITHNEESILSISMETTSDGNISFYWNIESEDNWDKLYFYIDDEQMEYIDGFPDWVQVSYPVSAGEHTFMWKYDKDGSDTSETGADAGWIDDITFPPVQTYANDLSVLSISGPGNVNVGGSYSYDITVKNNGDNPQNAYTVKLMKNGSQELASSEINATIASGESVTHSVVWIIPGDYQTGGVNVNGEVVLEGDENIPNNTGSGMNVNVMPAGMAEITVGDGNVLTYLMPINFYYRNSISQTIYFPSELNSGGMIEAISYDYNFSSNIPDAPMKVWMGEITQNNLSGGWISPNDLDVVFDGTLDFSSGENTLNIVLENPFIYTGGNLLVMVHRPLDPDFYSSSDEFYTTEDSEFSNRSRYCYRDDVNDPLDPNSPPDGSLSSDLPNTTFHMVIGGMGTIDGTVTNSDGENVSGAEVSIVGTDDVTYTNASGYFVMSNVPEGEYDLTATAFGYNPGNASVEVVEDQTSTANFVLSPLSSVGVSGFVVGSDFPEIGLDGAEVSLTGFDNYETTTDADGNFQVTGVYSNYTYSLTIGYDGYNMYTADVFVGTENNDLGTIVLEEYAASPANVAVNENGIGTRVDVSWNRPGQGFSEFRYDDGVITGEIGIEAQNAVLGAVHEYNALINQVSWYLTSANDNHNNVKIYIFGLNNDGTPNQSDLLYQSSNISNTDNQWNSYVLPEAISAPNGFLVGVSTPNLYTDVGLDDGVGEPWVYQPGTQLAITDWTNEEQEWIDLGGFGFPRNLAIRATGLNFGDVSRDNYKSKIVERNQNREFIGFNVYRLDENDQDNPEDWVLVAESLNDTTFCDSLWAGLPADDYRYAVVSLHTNNVESEAAFTGVITKTYNSQTDVTINITTETGGSPEDALVTLTHHNGNSNHIYSENSGTDGEIEFDNVYLGIYDLTIELDPFVVFEMNNIFIEDEMDINAHLTLTPNGDDFAPVKFTELKNCYPNPFSLNQNSRSTNIYFEYSVKEAGIVNLDIYNLKGQKVVNLVNEFQKTDNYKVEWNGKDSNSKQLSSGIYFYKMDSKNYSECKKLIIVR